MVKNLRIVFFGTPAFAVPSLDALLGAAPHTVVGVVTQPDRPRGRGQKLSDAPVKARALDAGLPVLQPERMRDEAFVHSLTSWNADLGVVAAYGKILTDAILAVPRLGMINVHGSLLPRYRGAAPVHRAIIDGEIATGITIMRVVKALDAGPMLAKDHRPIGPEETSEEVERDLAKIGARLLVAVVDQIARGNGREEIQDERARDVRAPADERGRGRRLGAAGGPDPQPHSRPPPVAARIHVSEGQAVHPAAIGRSCSGPCRTRLANR